MLSQKLQRKVPEVDPCSYLALPTGYGGAMQAVLARSLGHPAVVAEAVVGIGKHLRGATCRPW